MSLQQRVIGLSVHFHGRARVPWDGAGERERPLGGLLAYFGGNMIINKRLLQLQ
jgi:hypothetical protein